MLYNNVKLLLKKGVLKEWDLSISFFKVILFWVNYLAAI